MFELNFKKDWRMHKPLLTSFFIISLVLFIIISVFYLILKFVDLSHNPEMILKGIWSVIAGISSTLSAILPIVLMYKVIKDDLGKNKVHYSIFTPQSLLSWFLPKLLFIFIVQGLFALINLGYNYYVFDILYNDANQFKLQDHIATFVTSTFSIGTFALITLCMALYYSFRKKGLSWFLIVVTIIVYFIGIMTFSIIMSILQIANDGVITISLVAQIFINYGIQSLIGLIFIAISLYLFDKKVEY